MSRPRTCKNHRKQPLLACPLCSETIKALVDKLIPRR